MADLRNEAPMQAERKQSGRPKKAGEVKVRFMVDLTKWIKRIFTRRKK